LVLDGGKVRAAPAFHPLARMERFAIQGMRFQRLLIFANLLRAERPLSGYYVLRIVSGIIPGFGVYTGWVRCRSSVPSASADFPLRYPGDALSALIDFHQFIEG
jgi:hypothetical protein